MRKICAILSLSCLPLFGGELPELFEKPWTAWFAGYEGRQFHFGVNPDGDAFLIPVRGRDERFSSLEWIRIKPVIEVVRPNGRISTKMNRDDGWEALSEATDKAEKIAYRGTVTGGAKYEVNMEIDGDEIRIGGRILEKGELVEDPIRLMFRVRIPNCYTYVKENIEDKVEDDRLSLVMADGEKRKIEGMDKINGDKDTGKGIRSAELELEGLEGGRLELEAGDGGLFELWTGGTRRMYEGFTMSWRPDPVKDPEGKKRFVIKYR